MVVCAAVLAHVLFALLMKYFSYFMFSDRGSISCRVHTVLTGHTRGYVFCSVFGVPDGDFSSRNASFYVYTHVKLPVLDAPTKGERPMKSRSIGLTTLKQCGRTFQQIGKTILIYLVARFNQTCCLSSLSAIQYHIIVKTR